MGFTEVRKRGDHLLLLLALNAAAFLIEATPVVLPSHARDKQKETD